LRCGPSAHGISPFAALLRPDSSASASSAPAKAHLSFPRTGTSTSMILFEASAVLSNPSQPCRDRIRFGRSGCGGFDSWALTRPHQPSAARVADGGELMLPWALPLSGLPGTSWCKRPGSLIDLRLPPMDRQDLPGFAHRPPAKTASGGSPLLSLARDACRSCRDPAGPPDQDRPHASAALQRFMRPMPGSSDNAERSALGRTSRMRFLACWKGTSSGTRFS
jgi:hypothetical protein